MTTIGDMSVKKSIIDLQENTLGKHMPKFSEDEEEEEDEDVSPMDTNWERLSRTRNAIMRYVLE